MAWAISNWKGLLGGKNWVGVSHTDTHTHRHTLYIVTNKDRAHHTLPNNCQGIFIVETMTWEMCGLCRRDSAAPYCLVRLSDGSLPSSGLNKTQWPCRWVFLHCMCQMPDTILEFLYVRKRKADRFFKASWLHDCVGEKMIAIPSPHQCNDDGWRRWKWL